MVKYSDKLIKGRIVMAFDGIATACITYELKDVLVGGRIDKVLQPEFDEINLIIRNNGQNHRVVMSASSNTPRVHLSKVQKENPEKAPMFCMLLRKHLLGGRVVDVVQPDFERIIQFHIESKDELGDVSVKKLIVEIMGRHSNIILVSSKNKVLGSIKHIDFSVSKVRQLLPGMDYEYPPSQGKLNPVKATEDEILSVISQKDVLLDKLITDNFTGIGSMSAREMVYGFFGTADVYTKELQGFTKWLYEFFQKIRSNGFSPCLIYKNDKISDFSAIFINQYENGAVVEKYPYLNVAIESYYTKKDKKERMAQKTARLSKFIDNNIARCRKKLVIQHDKMQECKDKEKYKVYGDLLTANLHRIQEKATFITVENYYNNMEPVTIELKPELSPSKNAQRYYNLYQKCKNAEVMTKKQMQIANEELYYLESVAEELARAETETDINEIKEELITGGYYKENTKGKKKQNVSKPMEFDIDGYVLLVGKNNIQNDTLTLKLARGNDLWLHTKNIHGSHGIIKTNGEMPSDDTIVKCAKIVAYYSKARNSANVPVDFTVAKNVKKPRGAKPGMVIYDNYNTVNVKPEK
ncbi:MAG: NFACT family protein [Clostridia bacterium]|nr:NFACT family protein [Clostridia bacterium]